MKWLNQLIDVEGDYVNHPSDRGGPTRYGITQKKARQYGYEGDMKIFPERMARHIYINEYWEQSGFSKIDVFSPLIAEELVDTGVNCGIHRASVFLQKIINVFNQKGKAAPDVFVDGRIGPKTIESFVSLLNSRKKEDIEVVLYNALNCLQGEHYIHLALNDEKQEDFTYGWFRHRIALA